MRFFTGIFVRKTKQFIYVIIDFHKTMPTLESLTHYTHSLSHELMVDKPTDCLVVNYFSTYSTTVAFIVDVLSLVL